MLKIFFIIFKFSNKVEYLKIIKNIFNI